MIHRGLLRLIAGLCLLTAPIAALTAYAEPTTAEQEESTSSITNSQTEGTEKQEEKPTVDSQGRPILADGETGILIEQKSGAVLYESSSTKRMYPASTTKVMTCLLAVEAIDRGEISLEEPVTITAQMLEGLDPDGSNMALKADEVLTFQQLLWGLMIPSGNDAAMAIAYRLAGSPEAFAEKMNARAAELGLSDTHFANPHGLHDENHYTTAADMAKIARAGMDSDVFRNIVDIAHIKIPPTNKTEKERYYINTNGLISTMRYLDYAYKGATGIKTGRTTEAGNCLVSSAKRNGMELIAVLFNGKDVTASHKDSIRMLDYGFENYETLRGVSQGELLGESKVKYGASKDTVTLAAAENVSVVVPKGTEKSELEIQLNLPETLYAPLSEGQTVASVTVLHNGQELGSGNLVTIVAVERSFFGPAMALGDWLWSFLLIRILAYGILAVVGIVILLFLYRIWQEFKRAKRRKKSRNLPRGRR